MLRRDRVVLLALAFFCLLPSIGKAGQGGLITLVNGTPYNWRSSDQQSNHMSWWGFPDVITAGSTATLYVEWSDSSRRSSESGTVTFSLEGTSLSFQLQATAPGGVFDLSVALTNLSTIGHPQGGTIDLGWIHDGFVNFILAGEAGSFTSTRPPDAWMHENLSTLGNRSLRHLCIPGSHDAGMAKRTSGTEFGTTCNTVTQTKTIFTQLVSGVRYFDLRPVIHGGQFYAGHYTCGLGILECQGANGLSLDSIIKDVNAYTATHQELVVLHLSTDLDTDLGRSYPALSQDEWNRLLTELMRLNNRFVAPNPTQVDLTTLPLRDFIGSGAAVVVVAQPSDPRITLDSFASQGFYRQQNFPVFDSYSNTEDLNWMQQDQLTNKLQVQRPNPDAKYFLLSWTLTLQGANNFFCPNSILALAARARPPLYQHVLPVCNRWTYPNVLYIDGVDSPDIAALAMAVNSKASWDKPHGYVVYKGFDPDTSIYVAHTPDSNLLNGDAWSLTRMNSAINTSATPAAVSFAGGLYVLYKGAWNDTRIYIAQPADGNILAGGFWNAQPLNPAINTSTAPAAAVLGNTLYMLYKGAWSDDNVYIARSSNNANVGDGRSWSANRLNPVIKTSTAPVAAAFNGSLYLFYKGEADDPFIYVARSTRGDVFDGNTWSVNRLNQGIGLLTSDAPGVVIYKGAIYIFYKGYGNDANIWVARSTAKDLLDGTTSWTYTRLNQGINTTAAPKPVVVGDSLYLFYKGLESNIWVAQPQSTDPLNGVAWRWERLNSTINTTLGPGAAGM